MRPTDGCPCGSGEPFGRCCLALHRGERQAGTAEQLMRARYSAYAVGDLGYVWQTWHPRTRPPALPVDAGPAWAGLEILATVDGMRPVFRWDHLYVGGGNAKHLMVDLGNDVTIVPNVAGILGGVRVWDLDMAR